jgi:chemotaxis protein methyltransferase CheR
MNSTTNQPTAMNRKLFDAFREIVYRHSGISLHEGKESLVQARVQKRIRALGLSDAKEYLERLRGPLADEETVQLLDAISTNVTSFFRESEHFAFLREWLKQAHAGGQRRFRLWSAACSSGEEPYTIAMTAHEAFEVQGIDIKILATDISTRVLTAAAQGSYRTDKAKSIPSSLRERFMEHHGDEYRVTSEIRRLVVFRRLNLSQPPFPLHGPLDAVFCRNVMIYFDDTVRRKLLDAIQRLLRPGGYLFVGHAESLTGSMSTLRSVKPSIYCNA